MGFLGEGGAVGGLRPCLGWRSAGKLLDIFEEVQVASGVQKAVVLLSGGLDSATVLGIARDEGFSPHALSFRYGQRHEVELMAAKRVAAVAGATEHVIAQIDLRVFGGSALTAD